MPEAIQLLLNQRIRGQLCLATNYGCQTRQFLYLCILHRWKSRQGVGLAGGLIWYLLHKYPETLPFLGILEAESVACIYEGEILND